MIKSPSKPHPSPQLGGVGHTIDRCITRLATISSTLQHGRSKCTNRVIPCAEQNGSRNARRSSTTHISHSYSSLVTFVLLISFQLECREIPSSWAGFTLPGDQCPRGCVLLRAEDASVQAGDQHPQRCNT